MARYNAKNLRTSSKTYGSKKRVSAASNHSYDRGMTDYERIEKIIRYLDACHVEQPSLGKLAKIAGLSEAHFHRLFTRWAGATPKDVLKFLTAAHAKTLLAESRDVLGAALDAGLSGPGRLHDLLVSVDAVSPGEFRSGGAGIEIRHGFGPTPFGTSLIGLTKRGICHLAFVTEDRDHALAELRALWPRASFKPDSASAKSVLDIIFGRKPGKNVAILLKGSPFQLKVWEALLRVPEGKVSSYAELAGRAGVPGAARAAGSALAANSIAYLIPCHRVIRETGGFGAYRWGDSRKRAILAWEQTRPAGAQRKC